MNVQNYTTIGPHKSLYKCFNQELCQFPLDLLNVCDCFHKHNDDKFQSSEMKTQASNQNAIEFAFPPMTCI